MLLFLQSFLKVLNNLILTLIRNALRLTQRKDEITINININIQTSSHNESRPKRSRVKFGQIEIRTYESILGDNPACSRGPPVAIGWEYDSTEVTAIPAVDAFEDRHQISQFDLLMDRVEREQTLFHLGYTNSEIAAATRQNLRDKNKRRKTTDNLKVSYVEEKLEGFKKSVRRNILMKKSSKAMYKNWKKYNIAQQAEGYAGK